MTANRIDEEAGEHAAQSDEDGDAPCLDPEAVGTRIEYGEREARGDQAGAVAPATFAR